MGLNDGDIENNFNEAQYLFSPEELSNKDTLDDEFKRLFPDANKLRLPRMMNPKMMKPGNISTYEKGIIDVAPAFYIFALIFEVNSQKGYCTGSDIVKVINRSPLFKAAFSRNALLSPNGYSYYSSTTITVSKLNALFPKFEEVFDKVILVSRNVPSGKMILFDSNDEV